MEVPAFRTVPPPYAGYVTQEELAETIDRTTARIRMEIDRKFEAQSMAVGALRGMISQTDALLQRVLDVLEQNSAELEPDEYAESAGR